MQRHVGKKTEDSTEYWLITLSVNISRAISGDGGGGGGRGGASVLRGDFGVHVLL